MIFGNEKASIPEQLETTDFLIRPLLPTDVELDYAAVMETKAFLRMWDQSSWPEDEFTLADNLKDLERHSREHVNRDSFTFTVMNPTQTECLGCIYIFPCTARWLAKAEPNSVGDFNWTDFETTVSFWIRQSRIVEGMNRKLLDVLRLWLEQEWAFDGYCFFTNELVEQQVAMFESAGLKLQVKVRLPKLQGAFLAYT